MKIGWFGGSPWKPPDFSSPNVFPYYPLPPNLHADAPGVIRIQQIEETTGLGIPPQQMGGDHSISSKKKTGMMKACHHIFFVSELTYQLINWEIDQPPLLFFFSKKLLGVSMVHAFFYTPSGPILRDLSASRWPLGRWCRSWRSSERWRGPPTWPQHVAARTDFLDPKDGWL